MRLRGLGADRAAPDLHHHHRLGAGAREFQRLDQPVAIGRALEIAHDHAGRVILRAIGHGIGEIHVTGIARRRPEIDPQPPHPHQRHAVGAEGAALADDRHAAGARQVVLHPRREGGVEIVAHIGNAETVRPDQPHSGLARDIDHARLKRRPLGIDLREAGAEDHRAPHPARRAILDRLDGQRRRQGDHRQVGNQRRLGNRRIGRQPLHLGRFRIDRQDRPGKAVPPEEIHRPAADPPGIARGADHGNRTRGENGIHSVDTHETFLDGLGQ